VLRALDRGAIETVVPRWYRVGAVAQAAFPGVTARLLGHMSARRM
jgi:hypothetical protein